MTFNRAEFEAKKDSDAAAQAADAELKAKAEAFMLHTYKHNYAYQWTWLGLPIIQMPEDILATHEIIWRTKPTVIIETGVAWGGSIVLSASVLQLLGAGRVVGIDLNLYDHVRDWIMDYPFSDRIKLLKGSSVDPEIVAAALEGVTPEDRVMVVLDSNHSHEHVLAELRAYAPHVTKGQYLVVGSTVVNTIHGHPERQRPWGRDANPATALNAFLGECDRFEVDREIDARLLVGFSPGGYCRCVSEPRGLDAE